MNAKKAKAIRRRARELTPGYAQESYRDGKTVYLGECTKGAYRALKSGRVKVVES